MLSLVIFLSSLSFSLCLSLSLLFNFFNSFFFLLCFVLYRLNLLPSLLGTLFSVSQFVVKSSCLSLNHCVIVCDFVKKYMLFWGGGVNINIYAPPIFFFKFSGFCLIECCYLCGDLDSPFGCYSRSSRPINRCKFCCRGT